MDGDAFSRAQEHLAHGRTQEAEAALTQLLPANPGVAELHASLGMIAGSTGRHALAAQRLERACELDPQQAVYWHNCGEALRLTSRLQDAERAFRRAIAIDPEFIAPYDSLIVVVQIAHGRALAASDAA